MAARRKKELSGLQKGWKGNATLTYAIKIKRVEKMSMIDWQRFSRFFYALDNNRYCKSRNLTRKPSFLVLIGNVTVITKIPHPSPTNKAWVWMLRDHIEKRRKMHEKIHRRLIVINSKLYFNFEFGLWCMTPGMHCFVLSCLDTVESRCNEGPEDWQN